jgi:hypothetical protein
MTSKQLLTVIGQSYAFEYAYDLLRMPGSHKYSMLALRRLLLQRCSHRLTRQDWLVVGRAMREHFAYLRGSIPTWPWRNRKPTEANEGNEDPSRPVAPPAPHSLAVHSPVLVP